MEKCSEQNKGAVRHLLSGSQTVLLEICLVKTVCSKGGMILIPFVEVWLIVLAMGKANKTRSALMMLAIWAILLLNTLFVPFNQPLYVRLTHLTSKRSPTIFLYL